MALARMENRNKRSRLHSWLKCPYFMDFRGIKGHIVARHLPVHQAPYHCTLCNGKYTDSAPWVHHANSEAHRARCLLKPALAESCLGRSDWEMKVDGPNADVRPWGTQESRHYWDLQQSLKVSRVTLSLADLMDSTTVVHAAPDPAIQAQSLPGAGDAPGPSGTQE